MAMGTGVSCEYMFIGTGIKMGTGTGTITTFTFSDSTEQPTEGGDRAGGKEKREIDQRIIKTTQNKRYRNTE